MREMWSKCAKSRGVSKCAKLLRSADPYYPPMGRSRARRPTPETRGEPTKILKSARKRKIQVSRLCDYYAYTLFHFRNFGPGFEFRLSTAGPDLAMRRRRPGTAAASTRTTHGELRISPLTVTARTHCASSAPGCVASVVCDDIDNGVVRESRMFVWSVPPSSLKASQCPVARCGSPNFRRSVGIMASYVNSLEPCAPCGA